ncbi:MAG: TrpB-like pyridoxal phosphate-dependent enzyme [Armatimonadetes bacterium]|nr:TrpB-like pyridoxal phosphate-dependent enzyme [Armatimonadota bacterium]
MQERQYILSQKDIPTEWYNVAADLGGPPPPLHPGTQQPCGPDDLAPIFPMAIIEQEMCTERWIKIPEEVLEKLALWRPTPLYRATALEAALGTPAKIFYKYEGASPAGSHKLNTAVAQAYYNKKEGTKRIATETGAGQWGSALSMACNFFGLGCTVYMVKCSFYQKPYRKSLMHVYGAEVFPSPGEQTDFGKKVLAQDPDCPGSLGIAISEALEDTVKHDDVKYSLGSVLNHVILHQTVIGLESQKQMKMAGAYPDVVIGCVGGGSNFGGLVMPYMADKIAGKNVRAVAVEPTACPTLTRGDYKYDFGDTAQMTPLLMMYTLGAGFMPPAIHAGGLRYHGMAPLVSLLVDKGLAEAVALDQVDVFEAAVQFARTEGIVPAPESSHAICQAIREAKQAKEEGKERVILFNLSGHGFLDLAAYDSYLEDKLKSTSECSCCIER